MFENLMDKYKKLSINDKRDVNLTELKKMVAIIEYLCIENKIEYREIKSREIIDLRNSEVSEEDYLEAQYVYIEYLKEVIGALLDKKL